MSDEKLLDGKVIVVTGGGRGIGRATCLALAGLGARVVVNDIGGGPDGSGGDHGPADEVVDEIQRAGGEAVSSYASVTEWAGGQAIVGAALDAFGRIDGVVNNAGNLRDRSFLKMSDEEFDAVWLVHVKGTFWCAQEAARAMRAQGRGGAIVNTTSGAHFGSFGQTNYAAAKGAIASMTYTWALELARHGIRVNAIGPTGSTRMSGTFKGAELPYVDPALNGPLVVYLCSDAARAISGQIFGSGGERLAHMVQPHYGKTLLREGGWTVASIARHIDALRSEFGALGMLGEPYPFHAGVLPQQGD